MTSAADVIRAITKPVIAAALAAALTGCLLSERLESFSGPTMGSTYTVKYVRTNAVPAPEVLQADVEAFLAELDQQVSTYRDDSLIEQFNQAPAGACQAMPPAVLDLVDYGLSLSQASDGAFDMTVEPLLNLWGFGPKGEKMRVPSEQEIAQAQALMGSQHLRVEGSQLCKAIALELDFNAIAAGYAVDQIGLLLKSRGIENYMVEATGELKAQGRKPDGSAWRIAIEAPQEGQTVVQRIINLDGYGVSTSGDYRNYFEQEGQRYSHTLNPKVGAPINHKLAAVTVVAPSALEADGLSTLLLVLGPDEGRQYAVEHQLAALFVVREGEGFASYTTPAFDALFGAQGENR